MSLIIHLSDLHIARDPARQSVLFERLVETVGREREAETSGPALLVVTGDVFDSATDPAPASCCTLTHAYSRPAISLSVVEVFAQAGRADDAMREIDEALAYVEESDERAWESELHRLRGDLLREQRPASARRSFEKALEVAHLQGASSVELRAALSIAKLSRGDNAVSAREVLQRTYATFKEGLETADLVDAHAFISAHGKHP